MHRTSYLLLLTAVLLTSCSSPYRDPNFPDDFPSSPSIIVEENGWKSLAIVYQRNAQGRPITFENPNKSRADSWVGGTTIIPVENGQEELILLTDNQLKDYDDYDRPATEKFTWLDRVTVTGSVVESKKLDRYISPENIPCSWGIKNDSSLYRLSPEGVLYQDEKLISSFELLKTTLSSARVSVLLVIEVSL